MFFSGLRCVDKNLKYRKFDDCKLIRFTKWVAEKYVYQDPKSTDCNKISEKNFFPCPRELTQQ